MSSLLCSSVLRRFLPLDRFFSEDKGKTFSEAEISEKVHVGNLTFS